MGGVMDDREWIGLGLLGADQLRVCDQRCAGVRRQG
jgi:hypothetical protein